MRHMELTSSSNRRTRTLGCAHQHDGSRWAQPSLHFPCQARQVRDLPHDQALIRAAMHAFRADWLLPKKRAAALGRARFRCRCPLSSAVVLVRRCFGFKVKSLHFSRDLVRLLPGTQTGCGTGAFAGLTAAFAFPGAFRGQFDFLINWAVHFVITSSQ